MMRKPMSGAIWGLILGIATAIVIQQQGIWPLDRLSLFLLPGLVGLIGILLTSLGRSGGGAVLVTAVVITGAATAYGATGLGGINTQGFLTGGCTVNSLSDVDFTTVDDTSKRDPFEIDPNGGLSWIATSPTVFDDYAWEIWVDVGGFPVTINFNDNENNDDGDQSNEGDVANVSQEAEAIGIPSGQLRGVFEVGGFASTCDGLAFVKLTSGPLETLIAKVAAAIALISLLMLIRVALSGRGGGGGQTPGTELEDIGASATDGDGDGGENIATAIAAGALASEFVRDDPKKLNKEDTAELIDSYLTMDPDQEPPPPPHDGPPSEPPQQDSHEESEAEEPEAEEPEAEEPLPGLEE